jgi:hypothetical protein
VIKYESLSNEAKNTSPNSEHEMFLNGGSVLGMTVSSLPLFAEGYGML